MKLVACLEDFNLAHASNGTKVHTDVAFAQQGDRFPIARVIDGKYGTQALAGKLQQTEKTEPWIEFIFEKPVTGEGSNEFQSKILETDYLEKKNKFNFDQFLVNVKLADGNWKEIASIQKIRNRIKKEKPLGDAVEEINHLAYRLSEEGPRPSFVGSFIKPEITHVLHRGSPENPRAVVLPGAPKILSGDLGVDNGASGRTRRAKFADWMMDDSNPLTARVMASGFGNMFLVPGWWLLAETLAGREPPSHPELLDWIAGDSLNPLVRGYTLINEGINSSVGQHGCIQAFSGQLSSD